MYSILASLALTLAHAGGHAHVHAGFSEERSTLLIVSLGAAAIGYAIGYWRGCRAKTQETPSNAV